MNDFHNVERPKPSKGDTAHTLAKVVVSAIPWVGGPAAELFSAIITPPLTKRRDEWIESIGNGLKDLSIKVDGFSLDNLSQNEMFITTVMQATQVAIRNHQKEKLEALRNAILNAAMPNPPEEDIQMMFLNFIDTLTPWHLRILKFFDDPKKWYEKQNKPLLNLMMGGLSTVLEDSFPDLKGRRSFYDLLFKDLYSRGLTNTDSLHTTMSAEGLYVSRTTDFGKQFLSYIANPLESN